MSWDNGRLMITFNGEIYNFRDLRATLETRGHRFRSHTDTEVILAAYDQWGTDCVQHFVGMFARPNPCHGRFLPVQTGTKVPSWLESKRLAQADSPKTLQRKTQAHREDAATLTVAVAAPSPHPMAEAVPTAAIT